MRAIQVREFGGPEVLVLEDVAEPVAGPEELVIEMSAVDVIYLHTLLRSGWGQDFFPLDLPYVPGGGGAGTVRAVGAGVDSAWIGRRVLARASTGYAEKVVANVESVVEIPDDVDDQRAGAVLHDGATAISLAGKATIAAGDWVLVAAAAGGAGSILVQLARDAGARVVAAARGERKLALARDLGAEATVDYSQDGWVEDVRAATGGTGVDVVFDGAGGKLGGQAFETAAKGGRFVTYGTASGDFTDIDPKLAEERQVTVHNALGDGPPEHATVRAHLTKTLELTAHGRIRPAIGATYPLERARDAHAALAERNTVGKSLLLP